MNPQAIALNRFGLGARPADEPPAEPRRWLLSQLARYDAAAPAWARQPATGTLLADFQRRRRALRDAPEAERQALRQTQRRDAREGYLAAVNARLASALDTPAPFVERLVHFWSNHFAISVEKPQVLALAGAYEAEAIRPHVLGRFEDLLLAAVRHPAMLVYLDQAQSVGPGSPAAQRAAARNPQRTRGLNENLAREIMELHTLGVRTGYTQQDVTEFARALTGWSVAAEAAPAMAGNAPPPPQPSPPDDGVPAGFQFRPALHEPGPRTVFGRSYAQPGEAALPPSDSFVQDVLPERACATNRSTVPKMVTLLCAQAREEAASAQAAAKADLMGVSPWRHARAALPGVVLVERALVR